VFVAFALDFELAIIGYILKVAVHLGEFNVMNGDRDEYDVLRNKNPVARELIRKIQRSGGGTKVEKAVLKYARPFIGIERPKGFRQRAQKQCFANAFGLADAKRGFYVEGYALHDGWLFQHAWITLDGLHAVDVTLRGPVSDYEYFGVPFSLGILLAEACSRQHHSQLPLLDHFLPKARMEALVQNAIASPPEYACHTEPVAPGI
jgi:hypothetical protein